MTAVSPLIETEYPKKSSGAASEAVSLASWTHSMPSYRKTYAAPEGVPA